ncbi:hypothetical protein GY45DRAFT_1341157, partial [Cubamyces sp. BRFM 1775]
MGWPPGVCAIASPCTSQKDDPSGLSVVLAAAALAFANNLQAESSNRALPQSAPLNEQTSSYLSAGILASIRWSLGVPFIRNTYTILAYKKPNSDGTFPANDRSSHTDPRLGLLGLTGAATAVQQFHQDANNIPELVPLDSPLMAVELGKNLSTFRATTQEALGVRIVRAPTPVQGWTESGPASPLVKLPASALRRPTLP